MGRWIEVKAGLRIVYSNQKTKTDGLHIFSLFFCRVCQVSDSLKRALTEVVNEGLLNSVLPYLTPNRKGDKIGSRPGCPGGTEAAKDNDAAGTDSTTGNASSTLAGADSSNQVATIYFKEVDCSFCKITTAN